MTSIVLLNALVLTLVVSIHYEALRNTSVLMVRMTIAPRLRVVVGVFLAIFAHIVEVLVFGCMYFILLNDSDLGGFIGMGTTFEGTLTDCTYFSFATYTSLGFGDVVPTGPIRFLAGIESLVGLVMIGWTASFLYVEMTQFWSDRK